MKNQLQKIGTHKHSWDLCRYPKYKIRYCQDTVKKSVRKYRVRMSGIPEL